MPKNNSGVLINLAKGRGETFIDRFIVWALNAGRIIIILTEVVALGAFLYRFSLDRHLSDLHDRIVQEEAIVKILKNNETTFRNLQDRIGLAKTVMGDTTTTMKMFNDIIGYIPSDVDVRSITFSPDGMHIDATAQSIASFTSLVDKIKAYPTVASVSIDRVENKTSTGTVALVVSITFRTKTKGITR